MYVHIPTWPSKTTLPFVVPCLLCEVNGPMVSPIKKKHSGFNVRTTPTCIWSYHVLCISQQSNKRLFDNITEWLLLTCSMHRTTHSLACQWSMPFYATIQKFTGWIDSLQTSLQTMSQIKNVLYIHTCTDLQLTLESGNDI